jgi:hypothetical protein
MVKELSIHAAIEEQILYQWGEELKAAKKVGAHPSPSTRPPPTPWWA